MWEAFRERLAGQIWWIILHTLRTGLLIESKGKDMWEESPEIWIRSMYTIPMWTELLEGTVPEP